jgi:hypothetical protein
MVDGKILPAVQKAYDINLWLLRRVERFSRQYKFTLGDRIQTTAIDLSTALVEATHSRRKDRPLFRANRLLDQLRLLVRLAVEMKQLSAKQLLYIARHNDELGRMIGGWLRSIGGAEGEA